MRDGPFCDVPGCVQDAAGAVLVPYLDPDRLMFCEGHLRPLRRAIVQIYGQARTAILPPRREMAVRPHAESNAS